MNKAYSVTSNVPKLLKHLEKLQDLQKWGKISPVMIHGFPTHRCNLDCIHCCFKNRENKILDMPIEVFKEGIDQFTKLGTHAIELTGGGDPTLWPHINEGIDYLYKKGWYIGMNTNGILLANIKKWNYFSWVRISLNTLDYKNTIDLEPIRDKTKVSFCYIYHERSKDVFERVINFANEQKIICRIAPDCIKPVEEIDKSIVELREELEKYKHKNEYAFLSDFNIVTKRHNQTCRIYMIKPCFYTDGYIYPCPSSELSVENKKMMQNALRLCKYDEVFDFYRNPDSIKGKEYSCQYCKYSDQQRFLEMLFMETEFNEFA